MNPLLIAALFSCSGPADTGATEDPLGFPRLMVTDDHRSLILSRVEREPYASILADIREIAARPYEQDADPAVWDHDANGHNAETAQANAFLAWLYEDEQSARTALSFMRQLEDDFETNDTWDVNIRMPHTLIGYANALDLLCGTEWLEEGPRLSFEERLGNITDKFYEEYVLTDITREVTLGVSQNNHPIRTAAAIGYAALALPNHPDSQRWLDWAVSELDYLWGEDGQYVQPDGGVSEGPHYYGFAFSPSVAFFIAMENSGADQREYRRDCINRSDEEPWAGHGCVDGERFAFENPIRKTRFHQTVDWSINLRLPSGLRPPLADSYFTRFNGGALLTSFGGEGYMAWDWINNTERPYDTSKGLDLAAQHLAYYDDTVELTEPPWRNLFLPDAGNAVMRSGWGTEDSWLLLVAENGSARKTLHDHVDGTSFSLAAYGEYLLMDPGYYKPDELDNAVTAQADSHNVVLIDGQGAPDKGLLLDFGDTDAFLENTWDGERIAYAEAHTRYQDTDIERSVVSVEGRYFIVADRMSTERTDTRRYTWRLHGWAGEDDGGTFTLGERGASWERGGAGVDVYVYPTRGTPDIGDPEFVKLGAPSVHEFDLERNVAHHGVLDVSVDGVTPGFLAVLAPYKVGASGADGPLAVEQLDLQTQGVLGWQITHAAGVDVVLMREPGTDDDFTLDSGHRLATDGELALVRLDGSLGLVVRGEVVSLDGEEIADSGGYDFGVQE